MLWDSILKGHEAHAPHMILIHPPRRAGCPEPIGCLLVKGQDSVELYCVMIGLLWSNYKLRYVAYLL